MLSGEFDDGSVCVKTSQFGREACIQRVGHELCVYCGKMASKSGTGRRMSPKCGYLNYAKCGRAMRLL